KGKAASCKPLIFAYQAAFSGVAGSGTIDGQAAAWKTAPPDAALPDLLSHYESQGFPLEGVTLANAPGVHAGMYKTPTLIVADLKIDSATGSGLLLSNVTGGAVENVWIRVPGQALRLQASILGQTNGIHIDGLHIFGGLGMALGETLYP